MTNADDGALTAEFEYAGYTGLFTELFGPKGKPLTSMYWIFTAEPYPLLRGGASAGPSCRSIPEPNRVGELLNHYNLREQTESKYLYAVGVWKLVEAGHANHLCQEVFLPTLVLRSGMLTNSFMNAYGHSE